MPKPSNIQTIEGALEEFIDRFGLSKVVDHLATVCAEKATHIQHAWQDATLSAEWNQASSTFILLAANLRRRGF